jgi:hypothetical protein
MPDNIGNKVCLLHFKAVCWGGTKTLPNSVVEGLTGLQNTPWLTFTGRKSLVEPGRLEQIKNVIRLTRQRIKRYSLPFPVTSVQLLSLDAAESLRPYLEEMKAVFGQLVETFAGNYMDAIMEAEINLGEHFQHWNYPQEIRSKFSFDWHFMLLPGAGAMISEEVQEEEMKKFTDLMAEARRLAVIGLRKQFAVIVSHLVKELSANESGRRKVIKNDVFDRLLNFFDEFKSKNIFQDEELARLVEEAQTAMSGLDEADDLSQNWLGRHLQEQFSTLRDRVNEAIVDRPRRLIRPPAPPLESPAAGSG